MPDRPADCLNERFTAGPVVATAWRPAGGVATAGAVDSLAGTEAAANSATGAEGVGVGGLVAAAVLWVLAVAGHLLAAALWQLDTPWFAASGWFYLAITAASHGMIGWRRCDPVVGMLLAMAVRLVGVLAMFVILLNFSPLAQSEAVFNLLFWYITLTSFDLIAIVRRRGRVTRPAAFRHGSAG